MTPPYGTAWHAEGTDRALERRWAAAPGQLRIANQSAGGLRLRSPAALARSRMPALRGWRMTRARVGRA